MPEHKIINKRSNDSAPYFKVKTNLKAGRSCAQIQNLYYNNLGSNPSLATAAQSEMIKSRCEVGAPQYS